MTIEPWNNGITIGQKNTDKSIPSIYLTLWVV